MNINLLFWNPRFSLHNDVIIMLIFIIGLAVPFNLNAIDTVLHQYQSEEPDSQLEDVLYLSASVVFAQEGYSSTRKKGDEDYVLLAGYTASESIVEIRYTLFRSGSRDRKLVSLEFVLTIDYSLTEYITQAVMQVLKQADLKPITSTEGAIDGVLSESLPELNKNDVHSDVHNKEDLQEVQITGENPGIRFDSSISGLFIMLLGDITEYLHYSAAGSLLAGVTWPQKSWSITLGVKLLFMRAFNDAGIVGGPLYFSLAGLNLQLGLGADKIYRFGFGLSGGATLITVPGDEQILTKTAPYIDVSVYSRFRIGKYVTLGGEVAFLTIFDNDLLIMGVSPSLSFGIEV